MYEVVIHVTYGGFSLSEAAVTRVMELMNDKDIDSQVLETCLPRHHPALVQTVKELGGKAHGDADKGTSGSNALFPFDIVAVEDEYMIEEYDGMETVREPGAFRWTNASDASLVNVPWYLWKPGTEEYEARLNDRKRETSITR